MASSYTGLGTELMTTGENAGTWGTTTNTNLQIIEQISGGYVEQSIAGGVQTTTLSVSDGSTGATLGHRIIKFTGTITGNQTVTIPLDVQQMYVLVNGTSGAYTVNFKYVSGSGNSVTFAATDKGTKIVYAAADHASNPNLVDSGISSTGAHDLDGNEFILDADADTSITADTDDQIDIRISGADDFQFTANTFTAQAGSTIAAQALTATTVTASGIVKTDDTTEATSTTDGSLQTDGGLSVAKDAVLGDDLKLLSDSAVLSFGADSDTTLTHTDGTGLTLNSTNKLLFRDTGLYINSSTDGQLDLVADTEIQIAATTIDINGAIAMDGAITGATNITLSGELDAATLDISGNADIDGTLEADAITINGTAIGSIYGAVAGSSSIVTTGALDSGSITSGFGNIDTGSSTITTTGLITGGSLDIDDVLINGTTIGHTDDTDLITLADGVATVAGEISVTTLDIGGTNVTATAAEINLIDGGTSRGTTAVADGDGLLVNDGGTMRMTNVTTLKTYFQSGVGIAADDISAGDGAVTLSTSSGNITIDATAGDTDIIFKGTDSSSDITALTLDMSDAGTAIFNNDVSLDSDSAVLKFGDDQDVTLTHTDGTGLTLNSTSKLTFGDAATFINQSSDGVMTVAGEATIDLTASTAVLVSNDLKLDSDSAVLGFGADNDTTLTHTDGTGLTLNSTNKLTFNDTGTYVGSNADGDLDVVSDGTAVDSINIESAGGITLDAGTAASGIIYEDDGTEMLRIHNSSSDVIVEAKVQDKDIIFKGDDGGSGVTALTLDMSNAGAAIFSAAAYNAEATLTDGSTPSWNAITQPVAKITIAGNRTIGAASGGVAGAFISLLIIQDGTGSRTMTWNAAYEFASDTAPTLTTTANLGDLFVFRYNGSKWLEVGRNLALTLS
jgi:cytoskeletal protein CcmA (bactofilin family)